MLPQRATTQDWRPFEEIQGEKHTSIKLFGRSMSSQKMCFSTIGTNPSEGTWVCA